jgi:hypothetical protein
MVNWRVKAQHAIALGYITRVVKAEGKIQAEIVFQQKYASHPWIIVEVTEVEHSYSWDSSKWKHASKDGSIT